MEDKDSGSKVESNIDLSWWCDEESYNSLGQICRSVEAETTTRWWMVDAEGWDNRNGGGRDKEDEIGGSMKSVAADGDDGRNY